MRRRACVGFAIGFAAPLGGRAQPKSRLPRVGIVFIMDPVAEMIGPNPQSPDMRAFLRGLREHGFVDGHNVVLERRSAEGRFERLPALMHEMAGLPVDVIVANGNGLADAQRATSTIPIVALVDRPVGTFARPSENVTGVVIDSGPGIYGKRLQLLKEIAPRSTRVAVMDYKYVDSVRTPGVHRRRRELEAVAPTLGLTLIPAGIDHVRDLPEVFATISRQRADAILEMGTDAAYVGRRTLIDFAARERLPAIYALREHVDAGGLVSYAPSLIYLYERCAAYVAKILKGAKPSELPFEQPTKLDLVVNSRTAKAMGLTLPRSIVLRAAEVIE